MLLDLSANGNFSNRYLALYHQGHLWLGMLALSIAAFMRQPLGRGLTSLLSIIDTVAQGVRQGLGSIATTAGVIALMICVVAAVGALLSNMPQLTSELGRLWLIVGAAGVLFLLGGPNATV